MMVPETVVPHPATSVSAQKLYVSPRGNLRNCFLYYSGSGSIGPTFSWPACRPDNFVSADEGELQLLERSGSDQGDVIVKGTLSLR